MKNNGRKNILVMIAVLLFVLVVFLLFIYLNKGETEEYRLVKVEDIQGDVVLLRDDEEEDIFVEMHLIPDDQCSTEAESSIQLLVDDDKHILAKDNTTFVINAEGNPEDGIVSIELKEGEGLFQIENKLSENDVFEVNTPNAALSVRGTMFLTSYNAEESYTFVEVFDGVVCVEALDEEQMLEAGDTLTIYDDRIVSRPNFDSWQDAYENITHISQDPNAILQATVDGYDPIDNRYAFFYNLLNVYGDEIPELIVEIRGDITYDYYFLTYDSSGRVTYLGHLAHSKEGASHIMNYDGEPVLYHDGIFYKIEFAGGNITTTEIFRTTGHDDFISYIEQFERESPVGFVADNWTSDIESPIDRYEPK